MHFRFAALPAAFFLSAGITSSAFAQTKPKTKVPADRTEARSIVNQLVREGRIMRSSQVKRGMRGVARSVFQGTKIEEFPIVVLGNLERVQGGADIILIKVLGGPVVQRNSGIIAGMSGSPVYINNKMVGAIALGWGFPKEPIGGVTPIESMIQSSLPDKAGEKTRPKIDVPASSGGTTSTFVPRSPLKIAGRDIRRVEVSRDPKRLALRDGANGATMTLKPVSTLLQVSGYSRSSLPRLKKMFEPYGVEPVMGIPSKKTGVKASLAPGAAIGVQLVSGDMDQSAVGTVTFRWGKRVLAFGHPMFGQGAVSMPITTSYIHEIFPSYQRSFKLASPIDAVGAMQQDTQFAIGGTIGNRADTIPMTVSVREPEREISKTYRVRIMKDPLLTPQLIAGVAIEAIETTLGQTSDKMVRVGLSMKIDGAAPIKRRNLMYANQGVTSAALFDLGQTLGLTQGNEFARGSVERVDLSVLVEPTRQTARIKSLTADRNKVKAGESVGVRVALELIEKPGTIITKTFQFSVPEDAPSGSLRIAASAAANFWPLQMRVGGPPPEPTTLPQLVDAWAKVGPMNELLVVASTPRQFLQVEQQKIKNPPPTFSRLLQTAAVSNFGAYNETEERREQTEFMLEGGQSLDIPVESKRHPETAEAAPGAPPPGQPPAGAPPAGETPTAPGAPAPSPGSESAILDFSRRFQLVTARGGSAEENYARLFETSQFQEHRKYLSAAGNAGPMQAGKEVLAPTPTPAPDGKSGTGPNVTPTAEPTAAPTPTATPDPKLLARPAQSWVQAPADFLTGQFERTQVSSAGRLQIAPASRLLAKTADPFVWATAADAGGNAYLGMSNPARVVKVSPDGTLSTLWKSEDIAVTALALRGNSLYAGATPSGRVQRIIIGTGEASQVLASAGTFVGALEFDAQGRLLIGGGGESSKLWRIENPSAEARAQVLASTPQAAIRAISVRGDEIFFGTGGEAVLYRVAGDGVLSALHQVGERGARNAAELEILGVAASPEGVYFGASNSGTLWRWTVDGAEALYASPQQSVFAMRRAEDGRIYLGTGDKGVVYEIRPGRTATTTKAARLLEPQPTQALALAFAPDGDLIVGTGNSGSAYRISLGDTSGGTFTSTVLDAKTAVRWGALRLAGRGATVETRSGNTLDPDPTWSDWTATQVDGDEQRVASPTARYLQYRLKLAANGKAAWEEGAPQVSRLEILYRARNTAPQVTVAGVRGGEYWSGKQKVTWSGRDAEADTLRYKLSISPDDGATWQNVALENPAEESFELDTTKYKDGAYRVKVEASDAARNPDEPERDDDISQPFFIDNTPPRIEAARVEVTPDGPRFFATVTDASSPIAGAVWQTVKAEDKPEAPKPAGTTRPGATTPKPSKTTAASASASTSAITPSTSTITPTDSSAAITPAASTPSTTAASPEGTTPKPEDWNALAAQDGLFDSRRENIVGLLVEEVKAEAKTDAKPDAKPEAKPAPKPADKKIEVRAQDAAGNTVIVPVTVPVTTAAATL